MGKYTDEELSAMATEVINDLSIGGVKSFQLVIILSTATETEPERVIDMICELVIQ